MSEHEAKPKVRLNLQDEWLIIEHIPTGYRFRLNLKWLASDIMRIVEAKKKYLLKASEYYRNAPTILENTLKGEALMVFACIIMNIIAVLEGKGKVGYDVEITEGFISLDLTSKIPRLLTNLGTIEGGKELLVAKKIALKYKNWLHKIALKFEQKLLELEDDGEDSED